MAESRAGFGRYFLAILACAAWLAAYGAVAVVLFIRFGIPAHNWVDRQPWLLSNVCAIGLGLFYLVVVAFGWAMTQGIWKSVAGSPAEPDTSPTSGGDGRCPMCGFGGEWDGRKCGHCGYTHNRWKKGTTSKS